MRVGKRRMKEMETSGRLRGNPKSERPQRAIWYLEVGHWSSGPKEEVRAEQQRGSVGAGPPLGSQCPRPEHGTRESQASRCSRGYEMRGPKIWKILESWWGVQRICRVRGWKAEEVCNRDRGWHPDSAHRGESHLCGSQVRPEASYPAAAYYMAFLWLQFPPASRKEGKDGWVGVLRDWVPTETELIWKSLLFKAGSDSLP